MSKHLKEFFIFLSDTLQQTVTGAPLDWRHKDLLGKVGVFLNLLKPSTAHAPTLYDYDKNGYISPSNGREVSPEEQEEINRYNDKRRSLNNEQRKASDKFLEELLIHTWPNPLWNPTLDEIKRQTQIASTYPSPIILDLDGDGVIGTVGLGAGVYFDHAADGFAERTGWVAPGDGLLVWDRNANGIIDSGRELFGSETRLHLTLKAVNGFEALKFHDANGDGIIDANDPVFAELRVWVDANSDARTDTGELLTLEEAGVKSINLAYTNSTFVDAHGHEHRQVGSYTTTGRTNSGPPLAWCRRRRCCSLARCTTTWSWPTRTRASRT